MNIFKKSKTAKVLAVVAGAAIGLTMTASAVQAAGLTDDQVDAIVALLESFGADSATINNVQVALTGEGETVETPGTGSCTPYTFSTALSIGDTGADVKALQELLNTDVATQVAATGIGSAGEESEYFGSLTKSAVIKFQDKYASEVLTPINLTAGTGYVGSMTLAKLNELSTCEEEEEGEGEEGAEEEEEEVVTGPVSVSLADSSPTGGALIGLQAGAVIAAFEFKGNGTLESVTLKRTGISDQTALTSVYLYDGDTRLTDGYSFNTNSTLTMSNLNLAVAGSRVITVKADIKASPTTDQATIIATLTSFTADGVVSEANVSGGTMQFASGTLAAGVLSGDNNSADRSVNAGTTGYTFWTQSLQVNTRALTFSGANFRMIGSAPSDALSNIKMYVDGIDQGVLASIITIGGVSYVSFDMTAAPLTLATGSHTVDVRATIEKGSARTIQLSLQQAADLTLTDGQMGVNIAVTVTGSGTLPRNAGTVNINAGTVTVAEDVTFKSLTNVTGGATGVVIGKYTLHAYGEDVKVSSLSLTPSFPASTTPAEAGLPNVTLYFNGSQVGSSASWTQGSGAMTFQLGSQLIIPAGVDSTLEVRADLRTTASANYTAGQVDVTLNAGDSNGQGQNSYTTLNFPTAAVDGTNLTMQTGLIAGSKNTGYSNQSVSPSTAGVKIGSYVLQNQSSSEGIRVTTLTVALNVVTVERTDFSVLTTSETATPVQPAATNTFSTDFILAPGETRTIDIFANTGSATGTASTTLAVVSVGVTSGVTSSLSAVTGQTITIAAGVVTNPPTFVTTGSTVAQLVAAAGGSTGGSIAKFNFLSTGGSATIQELNFTVAGSVVDTVTSITIAGKTVPVVGTVAYVTGLNLVVPLGGSGLTEDVTVNYSPVGTGGVASEATSTISITKIVSNGGAGSVTSTSSGVATSTTMTLVGSKPTFTVTDVNTTLTNGEVKIAEITITADSKGDINIGRLPISITSTGVVTIATSTATIVVKDSSNNTISTTHGSLDVQAGQTGTSTITFGIASTSSYPVGAGESVTFGIYVTAADVAGAVNTTSLSTTLGAAANIEWYDVAGSNTSAITGALINNYPTNTSVISN